jgi:hypothetical protein
MISEQSLRLLARTFLQKLNMIRMVGFALIHSKKHFGSWGKAIDLAGLKRSRYEQTTTNDYIDDLKRVAEHLESDSLTTAEIKAKIYGLLEGKGGCPPWTRPRRDRQFLDDQRSSSVTLLEAANILRNPDLEPVHNPVGASINAREVAAQPSSTLYGGAHV